MRHTSEGTTTMTKTLHLVHARVLTAGDDLVAVARRRGDSGQGTLEYIGIAVIVGAIIVALVGVGLPGKLSAALTTALGQVTGGK